MTISKNDLKEIIEEVFNERQVFEHEDQHQWIRERIKAEQDRKLMYRAITKSAISWSVPFLLTGLVFWFNNGHWPAS